jgi:hypothetical protein
MSGCSLCLWAGHVCSHRLIGRTSLWTMALDRGFDVAHQLPSVPQADFAAGRRMSAVRPSQQACPACGGTEVLRLFRGGDDAVHVV